MYQCTKPKMHHCSREHEHTPSLNICLPVSNQQIMLNGIITRIIVTLQEENLCASLSFSILHETKHSSALQNPSATQNNTQQTCRKTNPTSQSMYLKSNKFTI